MMAAVHPSLCEHTLVCLCCWRFVGYVLMYNKLLQKSDSLLTFILGCVSIHQPNFLLLWSWYRVLIFIFFITN